MRESKTPISAPSREAYTYSEEPTTSTAQTTASTYSQYEYSSITQGPPSTTSYSPSYPAPNATSYSPSYSAPNTTSYPASDPAPYPASYPTSYPISYSTPYVPYNDAAYPAYTTCPPGCTCSYSASYLQPAQTVTSEQIRQIEQQHYSTSPEDSTGNGDEYNNQWPGPDGEIDESEVNLEYAEETAKFPFTVIIQSIAQGLVGEQYASKVTADTFRTKLESKDSQRLSGLRFVKTFSQRDLNLQCTLLLEVIKYWSLEDTLPELEVYNEDEKSYSSSRSERSSRRESRSGKHKRRPPPPPRYWTRLENAAVVGLMLGLEFEVIKLILEARNSADLGEVDAILDTNSAEALELFEKKQTLSQEKYSTASPIQPHSSSTVSAPSQSTPSEGDDPL